jgi:flagellar biosynthesis protein FlhB
MAQKTEQPTSHKLSEARKRGEVFRSQDISQALLFVTAATVFVFWQQALGASLRDMVSAALSAAPRLGAAPPDALFAALAAAWKTILLLTLPLAGSVFVVSILVNFLQVKGVFSLAPLKPKLENLNPLAGFKKIFLSGKTWFELLKNLLKAIVVFVVAYLYLRSAFPDILQSSRLRVDGVGPLVSRLLSGLFYRVGLLFLGIGLADFLVQRRFYLNRMKMTKEEVIREYKQLQGDPEIKFARRELYLRLLSASGIENVPKASAVVVNPVHLAVALRYDGDMPAPRIAARGADRIAEEIVFAAKQAGIGIVPNITLARELYRLEVGAEIPPDLYDAVVIVLEHVRDLAEGRLN